MDFISLASYICSKVGVTDSDTQAVCLGFVKARHKMIYEGADWRAAQKLVDKSVSAGTDITAVDVPEVHHVLSIRLDGDLLDPVTASYIFESARDTQDDYATPGTPKFFEEYRTLASQVPQVRFYPPLKQDGTNHALVVLGKAPYDDSWTSPVIPNTENALIAFATADMWEYLHQVGKAQLKAQEGASLLQAAQQADTPAPLRPRASRIISPNGNSLGEMVDAVCDLVGLWTPAFRESAKNALRRIHTTVWDSALFPETFIVATTTASGGLVVLPHLIDKVIDVRINLNVSVGDYKTLEYINGGELLQISPALFDQSGQPVNYSLMLPVALPNVLNDQSFLKFSKLDSDAFPVFVKGDADGVEVSEVVYLTSAADAQTTNFYDTVYTLRKTDSIESLEVTDLSDNVLMTLGPNETERKHPVLRIYPSFPDGADQTIFVGGKRRPPRLMDDGDTCSLTGIENILIYSSAGDLLATTKPDISAVLKKQAADLLGVLMDRNTKQQTYKCKVTPYVETNFRRHRNAGFLG